MDNLISQAIDATRKSYSPYSSSKTGAALLCNDGRIFVGANIEIAGSTASCCAVRVAMLNAISSGCYAFKAIAATSEIKDSNSYLCGACRQMLAEFCSSDMPVILIAEKGIISLSVQELLPYWTTTKLLSSISRDSTVPPLDKFIGSPSELIRLAMIGRLHSYAPYSKYRVGAALLTKTGNVFLGGNVEQVARSSTICAERVALFKAILAGEYDLEAIAVIGGLEGTSIKNFNYGNPCAVCRQAISEFDDGKLRVYMAKSDDIFIEMILSDLLPYPFNNLSYC